MNGIVKKETNESQKIECEKKMGLGFRFLIDLKKFISRVKKTLMSYTFFLLVALVSPDPCLQPSHSQ